MKRKKRRTKDKEKKLIWIYIITIMIFISIFIVKGIFLYKDEIKLVDDKLYKAAKNLDYYIKKDYHFYGMDKKSYSKEEILRISEKITDLCNINDILYLYTIIDDDGMPTYTSSGGVEERIKENIRKGNIDELYWVTFGELEDDSIEETLEILNKPEGEYFIESEDSGGAYRSIYVIRKSRDGRNYIIGGDVFLSDVNNIILKKIYVLFLNIFVISVFFLGLIYLLIKHMSKLNIIKKDLDKEIEYDGLTNVYKREIGLEKINNMLEEVRFSKNMIYLWLFDIKDLTIINQELGTKFGNKVILSIVNAIKHLIREEDIIVRFNGDQFLVGIKNDTESKRLEDIGKLLNKKLLEKKFEEKVGENTSLEVRSILLKYEKEMTFEYVLRRLEEKMKNQKLVDKGENKDLELDIQRGIEEEEFILYYQPKINIRTKKIEFEALMRWNHKDKGIIKPNDFIKIAEKSSLIFSLTAFLIKQVEKDIKLLKTRISINISPTHFNAPFFLDEMLTKYNNLENIELELTEGSFLRDMEKSIEKMELLSQAGLKFSIDDFGTGYSSMFALANLPLVALKIDRSFVVNMFTSEKHMKILKCLIDLGKNLDLKVVIEGVEEKKEIDKLKELGAYIFQGYYYGKPEPIEEVLKKLANQDYLKKES